MMLLRVQPWLPPKVDHSMKPTSVVQAKELRETLTKILVSLHKSVDRKRTSSNNDKLNLVQI
jgi:hypothetical protein